MSNSRILKGGGVVIAQIFPKVPQSSRPESLGFPIYPLALDTTPLTPGHRNGKRRKYRVQPCKNVCNTFPWKRKIFKKTEIPVLMFQQKTYSLQKDAKKWPETSKSQKKLKKSGGSAISIYWNHRLRFSLGVLIVGILQITDLIL